MGKNFVFGYRRVSTGDQSLDRQDLGPVDRLYDEKASGKNRDRPELQALLLNLREGDQVRVWSIDRLGRSMADLLTIVAEIRAKGASIHFLSESLTFGGGEDDPVATLQFQMLSAFAQFERSLIERRRIEGVRKAQAEGRYKPGRPTVEFDIEEARRLHSEGCSLREIAKQMGVKRSTLHDRLAARSSASESEIEREMEAARVTAALADRQMPD